MTLFSQCSGWSFNASYFLGVLAINTEAKLSR